ncbi:hypothetical protein H4R19_004093 [Coemansia spiralis]|nr:hypothetical protein H4R19_004093 [Coemansia spiralis]
MGNGERTVRKERTDSSRCLLDIPDTHDDRPAEPPFVLDTAGGERRTFRVDPPSALLARLGAFLPQIAEANKKLEADVAADPSKVDIENIGSEETQYIEMDLGLGVFDMKPKSDGTSADDIIISARGKHGGGSSSSSSDDDSSDSDTSDHIIMDPSSAAARKKTKPQIEVLGPSSPMHTDSDSDSQ